MGLPGEVRRYLEVCTYHGLPDVFLSRTWPEKLLWALLTAFATFEILISGVQFLELFMDSSQRWKTSVNYHTEVGGHTFPNVTFCNLNPFNHSVVRANPGAQWLLDVLELTRDSAEEEHIRLSVGPPREAFDRLVQSDQRWSNLSWAMEAVSMVECSSVLVSCKFLKTPFECCDFVRVSFLYSPFRLCLTMDFPVRQAQPGEAKGITLVLNPGTEYTESSESFVSVGYKLYLSRSHSEVDFTTQPIRVGPGTKTMVSMSAKENKVKEFRGFHSYFWQPRPDCVRDEELRNRLALLDGEYDHFACTAECQQAVYLRGCGCALPGPLQASVAVCSSEGMLECRRSVGGSVDSAAAPCALACDKPCARQKVDASASSSPLAAAHQYETTGEISYASYQALARLTSNYSHQLSPGKLAELSIVELHYTTTTYEVVELSLRMSIDDLISTLGGVCGVWAGVSLLTIAQLILYLVKALVEVLLPKCRKSGDGKGGTVVGPGAEGKQKQSDDESEPGPRRDVPEWRRRSLSIDAAMARPPPKGLRRSVVPVSPALSRTTADTSELSPDFGYRVLGRKAILSDA